jgi:hypothetical protein
MQALIPPFVSGLTKSGAGRRLEEAEWEEER